MDIKNVPTETLLQWYANANATASCGGHVKGSENDRRYHNYAVELRTRGIMVPKDIPEWLEERRGAFVTNVEVPEGIYNGEGSF